MYPINEFVIGVMTSIRQQMHLRLETAWGPEAVGRPESDVAANAEPGTLGAENPTDVNDSVNQFLDNIAGRLIDEYDFDEDEAADFIFMCADELAGLGSIPDEDAGDQQMSEWLGRAASVGFAGYVFGRAQP